MRGSRLQGSEMSRQPQAGKVASGASRGAGATTILLIAFIPLRLAGAITWSWWWVTSPAWIPVAAAAAIGLTGLGHYAVTALAYRARRWARGRRR
jgi:hypothetical protein